MAGGRPRQARGAAGRALLDSPNPDAVPEPDAVLIALGRLHDLDRPEWLAGPG